MHFEGKTIWITGASSGIGEALALGWAAQKTRLILSARNADKLTRVQEECVRAGSDTMIAVMDLSDIDSISKTAGEVMNKYPHIDILVNNGGISQRSLAAETPVKVDRMVMETNFFGAITLTKLVLPSMINNKSGHIVVISSVVGKFGFPLRTAYSASKHALQGYFDSLRAELRNDNIKVSVVSPGRIQTNISINAINRKGQKHGIMDPGQSNGIPVTQCANKIIKSVSKGKKDIIIAKQERIMIFFRKFLPSLYYQLASRVNAT